jgi:hypothetical protein
MPAGYQVSHEDPPGGESGKKPEAINSAGLAVQRVEAFYRLSALLAEQNRDGSGDARQLAVLQRRFYRACQVASRALAAANLLVNEKALPESLLNHLKVFHESNQALAARLDELHQRNQELARTYGFEFVRAQAEQQAKQAAFPAEFTDPTVPAARYPASFGLESEPTFAPGGSPLPERGVPLRWEGDGDASAPLLQFTPVRSGQTMGALAISGLLLLLLAAAWVTAQVPGTSVWVRAFWPEQMVLLGCFGWQIFGLNLIVIFLISLGTCARLILLGQGILTLSRRWRPITVPPGSQG